jgi:hypothetical protein
VELELLHQDLEREHIGIKTQQVQSTSRESFIQLPREKVGSQWTHHGDYYILEKVISLKDEKDPERSALLTNHREFYVKTFRRGMQWIRQVAIHHANVQKVELELLEKHLG